MKTNSCASSGNCGSIETASARLVMGYGNTLTWTEKDKPASTAQPVEIQVDLDLERFYRMFVSLMSTSTPVAH